jgi:hypothetical protein
MNIILRAHECSRRVVIIIPRWMEHRGQKGLEVEAPGEELGGRSKGCRKAVKRSLAGVVLFGTTDFAS